MEDYKHSEVNRACFPRKNYNLMHLYISPGMTKYHVDCIITALTLAQWLWCANHCSKQLHRPHTCCVSDNVGIVLLHPLAIHMNVMCTLPRKHHVEVGAC